MKKIILIIYLFFISCDTSNECGQIIDKYETLTEKYYFNLINRTGTQTSSNIGGAGGEAEVTKEIYDSFNIGDEYCLE